MEHKIDNIYIYLWEDFNTIYIGRTINPKSRHYQHRHNITESTYRFSDKHHVEHPKMTIIETNLTIEEGIEREKYWIEYYRNNKSYIVLNKSCGGQIGKITKVGERKIKIRKKLTEEEKKQRQKEYYQKNKDRILEYSKKYAKTHKRKITERKKEYNRNYQKEHKEELLNKKRQYRKKNREKYIILRKKYREENREKILAYKRKYREKHREELRAKAIEYQRKIREAKKINGL